MVPAWGSSTRRILHPFTFVPSLGSVKILKITPGDTEVLIGSSVQIAAEIENPAHKPVPATLFVRQADKPELAQAMLPDETNGKYVAALSQVLAPLQYRLQIGDTQTQLYKVAIYEKPTVAEVEAAYEFPAYLAAVARDRQAEPGRSRGAPVHAGRAENPSLGVRSPGATS